MFLPCLNKVYMMRSLHVVVSHPQRKGGGGGGGGGQRPAQFPLKAESLG